MSDQSISGWRAQVAKWLGIPIPSLASSIAEDPDRAEERLEEMRARFGGQIAPLPVTVTRWHLTDLEQAIHEADVGNIQRAAQLRRSLARDGVCAGALGTRCGGMVRLPRKFTGRPDIIQRLLGDGRKRGIFKTMCPTAELGRLAEDGIVLGVGVGEMLDVPGLSFRVLRRLDPEWLRYRWNENRWYYHSLAGPIPIIPGDRRWVLHMPGGDQAPWQHGLWPALGRSYVSKDHAFLYRENYSGKLAHPARVAVAPQGASEEQHQSWFQKVMAWGINTVFGLKPGYDVKLLESNGRGFDVFDRTIKTADNEFVIAINGQIVTTTGGAGFANANIHQSVRADLIQDTAEGLAHTLNTQIFPAWVNVEFGADALEEVAQISWDTAPPKDLTATAASYAGAAQAITALNLALAEYAKTGGVARQVDIDAILMRFAIPILDTSVKTATRAKAIRTVIDIRAAIDKKYGGRVPRKVDQALCQVLQAA